MLHTRRVLAALGFDVKFSNQFLPLFELNAVQHRFRNTSRIAAALTCNCLNPSCHHFPISLIPRQQNLSSTSNTNWTAKMILGSYRNPPYRSPSVKSSASPPPNSNSGNHSPKRKRTEDEISASPAPYHIDAARVQADEVADSAPNSPRAKVAERLNDLNLQQRPPPPAVQFQAPSSSQSPQKRLKRNPGLLAHHHAAELISAQAVQTPQQKTRPTEIPDSASLVPEVRETPDAYGRTPSTPPLSPGSIPASRISFKLDKNRDNTSPRSPHQQYPSPQPPTPSKSTSEDTVMHEAADPSSSPVQESEDCLLRPTELTWQDDEITGHDIDETADDDGEGINGIGFRPTPAIAHARSLKRRQQVNEWKTREAREARQKRIEKRRGGSSDPTMGAAVAKRVVRFAESFG